MVTKHGRMVTYHEGFSSTTSYNSLVKWTSGASTHKVPSCFRHLVLLEPIGKPKPLYLTTSMLFAIKGGKVVTFCEGVSSIKSRALHHFQSKLKPFYLHYQNAYSHQTWQVNNLSWRAATLEQLTLWVHSLRDHTTN